MKANKYLIFILGALGGLLYGYDNGVISGALLFIHKDIPLNSTTEGYRCVFNVNWRNSRCGKQWATC